MSLVATIDAGGSGVKVGVVSLETWRTVALVRRAYAPLAPAAGRLEWEPGAWWAVIADALADAVAAAGRPPADYAGVTCAGMRIPFVLVDEHCEPVAPGVLVADARGAAHLHAGAEAIGSDALYAATGHWTAPHFGLPKLLWYVRERPATWRRTRWVLQFCDWLLERLCGVVASEPSSASMSQLLDVADGRWAEDLLSSVGIDAGRLPPLLAAGTVAGGLRPALAAHVGLRAGLPVHVGAGDTHLACLGAAGLTESSIIVVAGTTTPIMRATRAPLLRSPARPLVSAHLRHGWWAAETNVGTSGAMLGWLRELSGRGYEELEALAATAPAGAGGVLVCAANPEWGPDDWARVPPVTLVGTAPACGLAQLARAVLESNAHAVACNLARLVGASGGRPCDVILTGGGARSPLAAQLLADVLGRRVSAPSLEHAASLGGGMLVAQLERLPEAPDVRTYEPDAERHGLYAPLTRRYADAFARLRAADLAAAP